MSLESGRKLGLTASLIAVVVPVITVVLYGFLFLSLFGIFSSTLTGGDQAFGSLYPAGIGVAFLFIGVIGFAGIILFLLAMHKLSQYYNEPGIFKNALYGFLTNIIGVAVIVAILFAILFASIFSLATRPAASLSPLGIIAVVLGIIAAALVIGILSAVFYKRAFDKLGEKSGVHSFNTAGELYLIGIVLTIVLVGSLIVWIAWIYSASGFYSLKPKTAEPSAFSYSAPQLPPTTNVAGKKYCPYCGAEISSDSLYCPNCGRQIQQ